MALTRLAGAMSLWMWTLPPERHPQPPRAALSALWALYHANMLTAVRTSWAPCTRGTRGEIEEIGVEDITSRATTSACTTRPALLRRSWSLDGATSFWRSSSSCDFLAHLQGR